MTKDPLDFKALRALCDAAPAGPWITKELGGTIWIGDGKHEGRDVWEIVASIDAMEDYKPSVLSRKRKQAAFIAAARTALPALLDWIVEAKHQLERLPHVKRCTWSVYNRLDPECATCALLSKVKR